MRSASVIWLCVREVDTVAAMLTALLWLSSNKLPAGMVLRVRKTVPPTLLQPHRP